jgi:putative ABC transport system permease protein
MINRGETSDHRVTGVMRDLPRNSHLRLNMLIRFDPQTYFAETPEALTQWGNIGGWTYLALRPWHRPSVDPRAAPQWEKRNIPDQQFGSQRTNQGDFADGTSSTFGTSISAGPTAAR